MATRTVNIPGIGIVLLARRKGSTHLRLSITARGTVRVGMPYWTPYSVGISFAQKRADWISEQLSKHGSIDLRNGLRIGKSHRLCFITSPDQRIITRITANEIQITTARPADSSEVQSKARLVAEKALKKEANQLLTQRLDQLARKNNFGYSSLKIRKMTSRWGSCSSGKVITLSYYLMQLPWELIDYVLVHELLHTRHMHHGVEFWKEFEIIVPGAKQLRKQVNSHRPRLEPYEDIIIQR